MLRHVAGRDMRRQWRLGFVLTGCLGLTLVIVAIAIFDLGRAVEMLGNTPASSSLSRARWLLLGLAALTLLLALVGGWRSRRGGANDPVVLRQRVEEIAANDLSSLRRAVPGDSVLAALVRMTRSLAGTVNRIRRASFQLETEAREVMEIGAQLLSRADQQASALTQTASAMVELDATVGHNAVRAGEADSESKRMATLATAGNDTVQRLESTMKELSERSREIADVVSMTDELAFQTNILALNASVEAARAGTQGLGFGVVAQEVRRLATRSAEASTQIDTLLKASLAQIHQSAELAAQVGESTRETLDTIHRLGKLVGEISDASEEQARAVKEVNVAVAEIDKLTQQTAALARQANEAGNLLNARSNQLGDAIADFDLDDDGLQPRARTTREAQEGLAATGMLSG